MGSPVRILDEQFFKKAIEYRHRLLQFTYEEYPCNPNVFLEDAERQKLRETQISLDKIPKSDDTPSDFYSMWSSLWEHFYLSRAMMCESFELPSLAARYAKVGLVECCTIARLKDSRL